MIAGEGPDRERLERLASGLNGQVEFAGRVDDERLADLYARCLAVYYAPVDEDFGMVPYEAFLSAKPVVTTTDAGGPLEVVHDRETGRRRRARRRRSSRARARTSRAHVDEAKAWGRAGKAIAERVTWDACVDALLCRDEGRLLLAAAAVALRDRRLLDAAPAGAARARRRRRRASRASARRPQTSRSTTSATTPTRTAGSSTRCASAPASSSCTSTCCTT